MPNATSSILMSPQPLSERGIQSIKPYDEDNTSEQLTKHFLNGGAFDEQFFHIADQTVYWKYRNPEVQAGLYGEQIGEGKWARVYRNGDNATKVFKRGNHLLNYYEVQFTREYGGQAGLPKFRGVVPNGYQMEFITGETLGVRVRKATMIMLDSSKSEEERDSAFVGLVSPSEAQKILNRIVEFHITTGMVHGDLIRTDNIILCDDGEIRFIDKEWEKVATLTPQRELDHWYNYFTNVVGVKGLVKPETIDAETAYANYNNLRMAVQNEIIYDGLKVQSVPRQDIFLHLNEDTEELYVSRE